MRLKGARQVALVTGEEKIVPPGARYFFCTVESMPTDRPVDFLAIDEIQLCADPERGHVFTERLLHARGLRETMFLGAETMRPIIRALVPDADHISRPRFSTIGYSGPKKITRLPKRSAVVSFSAAGVYGLAELVRRRRGGTAVVLGALSPRTRNAQVAMFEAGEVDYLVATDAIGMGLNLDLDHVAFSRLSKFDGFGPRPLRHAEVAQIAGRAGRHMNDGTFGTTDGIGGMDEALVTAVETHSFEALKTVFWRNDRLDFGSLDGLLRSLERRPPRPELIRARGAEDHQALAILARDPEIAVTAGHRDAVALLWEVCQVPDFQKILTDRHARLLARLYGFLRGAEGRLPEDWVARRIARIDRTDGDIDALIGRISRVRTWTYIAHRGDWLADHEHWRARTRAIEDKLSDALHDRLTQRFVDKRAATLVSRLREGGELLAAVGSDGAVLVEGQYVGTLRGFRFDPDVAVGADDARALLTAARRALAGEIPARVARFCADDDEAFALTGGGALAWRGGTVARLRAGPTPLAPRVEILASDFLDGRQRERLRERLSRWLEQHLRRRLRPLLRLREADLGGPARGLAFQLVEALGTLPRGAVAAQLRALTRTDRETLGRLGLRIGRSGVFVTALMRPGPSRLRGLLWMVHHDTGTPDAPLPSKRSQRVEGLPGALIDAGFAHAIGYRLPVGPRERRTSGAGRCPGTSGRRSRQTKPQGTAAPRPDAVPPGRLPDRRSGPDPESAGLPQGQRRAGRGLLAASAERAETTGRPAQGRTVPPAQGALAGLALRQAARVEDRPMSGAANRDRLAEGEGLRLDKWLWHARFFKSRSLAAKVCASGKVRVEGTPTDKSRHKVRAGDVLTFPWGRHIRVVRVLALGRRRGPAPEARSLYEDLKPPEASNRLPARTPPARPAAAARPSASGGSWTACGGKAESRSGGAVTGAKREPADAHARAAKPQNSCGCLWLGTHDRQSHAEENQSFVPGAGRRGGDRAGPIPIPTPMKNAIWRPSPCWSRPQ